MHGIGLEMASKPSSGTPKGALEGLCGWRIEATWAFDEVYAVSGQSEGRFRARTRFAGHFRADSVHGTLGRVACRAVRRVESHGGAHRAMRRPAPRVARRVGSSRHVLPRCATRRAPRSADLSRCVPHTPPPRCVLRAQRTCRVTSRLVARRSLRPADLSRTSRSADLSHRVPRPAAVRCAMPARVAPAQSTARSSRCPSRSGCPRSR